VVLCQVVDVRRDADGLIANADAGIDAVGRADPGEGGVVDEAHAAVGVIDTGVPIPIAGEVIGVGRVQHPGPLWHGRHAIADTGFGICHDVHAVRAVVERQAGGADL